MITYSGPVPDRTTVASYSTYAQAQRAVDELCDKGFPVDRVSVVGSDLRLVENVVGRSTRGRAAAAGAASGAWLGLFVGLLLSVFAPDGTQVLALVVEAVVFGVVLGAVLRVVAHGLSQGQRDFASQRGIVAARYEVQVDHDVADDAGNLLIKLAWRT